MKKIMVKLENVTKNFDEKKIIKGIDLEIYEGEFLTFLGPSGCGKTTLLRTISGLEEVSSGKVYIDDVDVTNMPPQKRDVNTIFQNFALFNHMSVQKNIEFGLKMKKISKEEIEKTLCDYLGCSKVLWVPEGIYNDETNGHIDNICNFVRPGEVVLAWTDDESDPQYEISKKALEYLESETDAKGRKLKIHKMYTPKPVLISEEESGGVDAVEGTLPRAVGDRLAASYVNYYTGNGFVAVPVFGDPNDEAAINLLKELYPDRVIEPIYAREILLGGGNIHCITQQVPR